MAGTVPVTLEGALPEGINHNCIWLPDSRMGGFFEGTILTLSKTAQGSGLLREAVNCIQATAKFICGSVQLLSLQPARPAATVAKQACRKALGQHFHCILVHGTESQIVILLNGFQPI